MSKYEAIKKKNVLEIFFYGRRHNNQFRLKVLTINLRAIAVNQHDMKDTSKYHSTIKKMCSQTFFVWRPPSHPVKTYRSNQISIYKVKAFV